MLKCMYKNEYEFNIDTVNNTITWNNRTDKLKQFTDGITGEITSIAGIYGYSQAIKSYLYFTPNIFKKDITRCNNWDKLNKLFKELI